MISNNQKCSLDLSNPINLKIEIDPMNLVRIDFDNQFILSQNNIKSIIIKSIFKFIIFHLETRIFDQI